MQPVVALLHSGKHFFRMSLGSGREEAVLGLLRELLSVFLLPFKHLGLVALFILEKVVTVINFWAYGGLC